MNYGGSDRREGRISFSSIILLVIFVSAAALIVAAVIWRPWFGDDAVAVRPNLPHAYSCSQAPKRLRRATGA